MRRGPPSPCACYAGLPPAPARSAPRPAPAGRRRCHARRGVSPPPPRTSPAPGPPTLATSPAWQASARSCRVCTRPSGPSARCSLGRSSACRRACTSLIAAAGAPGALLALQGFRGGRSETGRRGMRRAQGSARRSQRRPWCGGGPSAPKSLRPFRSVRLEPLGGGEGARSSPQTGRVKTGARARAEDLKRSGGKPGPRARTPPEAPRTPCIPPCIPPLLPRGRPHSPSRLELQTVLTRARSSGPVPRAACAAWRGRPAGAGAWPWYAPDAAPDRPAPDRPAPPREPPSGVVAQGRERDLAVGAPG